MKQYLELLQKIVDHGYTHEDRTGVGRISIIGEQLRFDLSVRSPTSTPCCVRSRRIHEALQLRDIGGGSPWVRARRCRRRRRNGHLRSLDARSRRGVRRRATHERGGVRRREHHGWGRM